MNRSMNYSGSLKWSIALLLGASLVACGGGSRDPILGVDGDTNNPVTAIVPPDASTLPEPNTLLGTAFNYGIFGGTAGMTNSGIQTVIQRSDGATADIGTIATANSAITGFYEDAPGDDVYTAPDGLVTGTIFTCAPSTAGANSGGNIAAECAIATAALDDLRDAYNALVAMPAGPNPGAGNLANQTLAPGVYTAADGSFKMEGGNLTLDAQGDPDAVWVFQMATSLTVGGPGAAAPQSVILAGDAQAKNVYWQVGSAATINAAGGGTMVGTIIAEEGVAISTAANTNPVTIDGRALSLGASVTVVNTVINVPAP